MKKRIISLILALSLVLSIGLVRAEDEVTAAEPVNEAEVTAAEHLQLLGLTDKAIENVNAPITRAELANVAANMLGIGIDTIGTGIPTNITDVDENPYAKQIHALVSYKILSGVNAYQYLPDNTVRYNEALKVLLSVLGYGEEAQVRGGYPNGYIKLSAMLRISVGKIKNHESITWGEFARLVEEFYDVPLQNVVVTGNEMTFSQQEGKTFLSHYHDVVKVTGKVNDNGYTTRTGESRVGVKNVLIGSTIVGKGNTDLENKIGAKVECYAKKDSNKYTALFYSVDNTNVDVIEIKAGEIRNATVDKIVYKLNGSSKTVKISPYADVIYNGTSYPDFDGELLKIENGKITLYDDDKVNGGYDLIVIEEYETFVVSSVSAAVNIEDGVTLHAGDKIITGTLGESVNLDQYETYFIYNDKYEEIDIIKIQPGYVASVYKSLTKGLCKIVFTMNNIDGAVSAIDTEERTYYTINDNKYEISHSLMKKINENVQNTFIPELGEKYVFMLDIDGNIAGYESQIAGTQYGYLTKMSTKSPDSFGDEYTYFRIATANGFVTLRTAKKVTVNGATVKTLGRDVINEPTLYVDDSLANDFEPQLIQFEVNGAGDIVALNTATTEVNDYGYNAEKFSLDASQDGTNYRASGRYIGPGSSYKYYLAKDAAVFVVPSDLNEEDFIVLSSVSGFPSNDTGTYDAKFYDLDSTMAAHAVVLKSTATGAVSDEVPNAYFFVEKAYSTLEADGEMHMRIRGFLGDSHKEYVEHEAGYLRSTLGEVKPGDILKIELKNGKSKFNYTNFVAHDRMIVKAERIITAEEIFNNKTGAFVASSSSSPSYCYGPIYARTENATTILINKDTANSDPATKWEDLRWLSTTGTQGGQFIYSIADQTVTPVKYNDIAGSSTVYEDGTIDPDWSSIVFIQYQGTDKGSKMTVLIREK